MRTTYLMYRWQAYFKPLSISTIVSFALGCASTSGNYQSTINSDGITIDQFVKVDCLLPGKVRRLGSMATFMSQRRLVQTTAVDCGIRGGEYTLYDRSNLTSSLNFWLEEAKTGDAQAQYYVGEIYENGVHGSPDYQQAVYWYEKSAGQGYPQAQVNLGTLYEAGLGVPKDKAKALNYYRSAANLTDDQLEYLSTVEKEVEKRLMLYKQQIQREQKVSQRQQSELNSLRNQLAGARDDLREAQTNAIQQRVVYVEVPAKTSYIQSLDKKETVVVEVPVVSPEDERVLQQLKAKNKEISSLQAKLGEQTVELARLRQKTRAQQEAVSINLADTLSDKQSLQNLLNKKSSELSESKTRLVKVKAEYEEEKKALQSELNGIRQQIENSDGTTDLLANQLLAQRIQNDELDQQLQVLKRQEASYQQEIEELNRRVSSYQSNSEAELIDRKVDESRLEGVTLELDQTRSLLESMNEQYLLMSDRNHYLESVLEAQKSSSNQAQQEVKVLQEAIRVKSAQLEDSQRTIATLEASVLNTEAEIEGIQVASTTRSATNSTNNSSLVRQINFGKFHALIIGNGSYINLPSLKTPSTDARELASVLRTQYGYDTTVLIDADRYQILDTLNKLKDKLGQDDNLLIYFAGHGEIRDNRGYWLPVDADVNTTTNWISTQQVTDMIATSNIRKVMVVADSCYSGILTRSALLTSSVSLQGDPEKYQKWLTAMARGKSRTVMSSGGLQPVLDSGGGKHSIFAKHFINTLDANSGVMDANTFYRLIFPKVKKDSALLNQEQDPMYAPIKSSNHQSVDFFFVKI